MGDSPVTRFDTGDGEYSHPDIKVLRSRTDGKSFDQFQVLADGRIKQGDGDRAPDLFVSGGGIPARTVVRGHSYAGERQSTPYGNTHPWNNGGDQVHDSATFASLMRDGAGGGHRRFMEVNVPAVAAGSDLTTVLGELPEDCVIEGIWYIPAAAFAGADTNTRKVEVAHVGALGTNDTFAIRQFNSGVDLTLGVPQVIYSPLLAGNSTLGGDTVRARDASAVPLAKPQFFPAITYPLIGTTPIPTILYWKSTHVGTGLADPGGKVVVRLGGRYRNTAVDGALLGSAGVYGTGWAAALAQHKWPIAFGIEVVATAACALNATTLNCSNLPAAIPTGWKIRFTNGALVTLNGGAAIGATSITVVNSHAAILAGEQGFATPGIQTDAYDTLQAEAVFNWMTGLNDAAADRPYWRELVRSVIAFDCCPYLQGAGAANVIAVAGNGAGAAWDAFSQPASGRFLVPGAAGGNTAVQRFKGAVGATPPTLTLRTSPAFQGTTLDLFFLALAGTGRGGRASIVVDGGTPIIVDTSGGFVSGGFTPLVAALTLTTTNGSATATGTGFTQALVGKIVENASVPAGRHIASVESATSLTLSSGTSVVAGTAVVGSSIDWCPMVKRITGLTPGGHTVVITLTAMDATDGSAQFVFMAYGFEVDTPVMWGNIPQIPSSGVSQTVTDCNTDSAAVIAGTAPALGTGTQEPALGSGVQLIDLATLLNLDTTLFLGDGKHPNAQACIKINEAFGQRIRGLARPALLSR